MRRFLTLLCCCLISLPVLAAKPTGLNRPEVRPEIYTVKNPVQQVQELLASMGLYVGALDGIMGPDLESAIRLYQKTHNLDQTGKITRNLIAHMQNLGRMRALIQKLDQVREERQAKARQALLANPRTRILLEKTPQKERADPTRDSSSCFKSPTVSCLLKEAVESSRAVFEDDMRDWALGEILAAQVSVGLEEDAMQTAARIKDSRLIIAALTTIAKTHIKEGKIKEALSALTLIPVAERRLSVLLDLCATYHKQGNKKALIETVNRILADSLTIEKKATRLPLQIEAAKFLAPYEHKRALELLHEIASQAKELTQTGAHQTVLRQSASAMAEIGFPEYALKTLDTLPDSDIRIPVLMAATRAFLKQKRFQAARNTLERISPKRYRSIILANMASALWLAQKTETATVTLQEAHLVAKGITLPFARNFALSSVAQSYWEIASKTQKSQHADQAYNILQTITDDRMKARGLWDLTHAARRFRFHPSEADLDQEAKTAINEVKSSFSKVWIMGDLAAYYQDEGDREEAKKAFYIGLENVEKLKNPWARSRALAKFAALFYRLD